MSLAQIGRTIASRLQNQVFGALVRHPNYRLYWSGALASNIGTWIQMVAQSWLVYQLTHSAFYLGAVGFATAIPSLLFSLFGGVLADRFERRQLMVATQTGSMIMAFLLSFLTLTGQIDVWHIMVISFISGVINSLNTPVRQSIISDLVTKEDLMNAIAVNSVQFHGSRMLGPALAGVLVVVVGAGWCFFINGLSFLAVIAALLAMKLPPLRSGQRHASMWQTMLEGLRYVRRDRAIFALLTLAAIPSLFGMFYSTLMPAFADTVLHVDAHGYGLLMSAAGFGAVSGALAVASLRKEIRRGRLMALAIVGMGLCLVAFSLSGVYVVSVGLVVGVAFCSMLYNSLNQTLLQTLAADHMRGRVLSLLTVTTFGFQPFGQLWSGSAAASFGPSVPVFVGGLVCAFFALWSLLRRETIRQLG